MALLSVAYLAGGGGRGDRVPPLTGFERENQLKKREMRRGKGRKDEKKGRGRKRKEENREGEEIGEKKRGGETGEGKDEHLHRDYCDLLAL